MVDFMYYKNKKAKNLLKILYIILNNINYIYINVLKSKIKMRFLLKTA